MRSSTSSDSAYKCEVPVIVTECTEEEGIELNEEGLLRGTYTSDTGASSDTPASVVFDGSLYEEYVSDSAECFAEISFGTGKVGIVSAARYFIVNMVDKSQYSGILTVSGCTSGTCTTLHTADNLLHDGYNDIDITTPWKYESYKVSGTATGGCKIAELELTGRTAFAASSCSATHTFNCDAIVNVRSGESTQTVANAVTYSLPHTHKVTAISPAYVNARLSEEITITGTFGSSVTSSDVTV